MLSIVILLAMFAPPEAAPTPSPVPPPPQVPVPPQAPEAIDDTQPPRPRPRPRPKPQPVRPKRVVKGACGYDNCNCGCQEGYACQCRRPATKPVQQPTQWIFVPATQTWHQATQPVSGPVGHTILPGPAYQPRAAPQYQQPAMQYMQPAPQYRQSAQVQMADCPT